MDTASKSPLGGLMAAGENLAAKAKAAGGDLVHTPTALTGAPPECNESVRC